LQQRHVWDRLGDHPMAQGSNPQLFQMPFLKISKKAKQTEQHKKHWAGKILTFVNIFYVGPDNPLG
jgi:hypothetical protein